MDVSKSRTRRPLVIALGASSLLNIALLGVVVWPDSDPADAPVAEVEFVEDAIETEPTEKAAVEAPSVPVEKEEPVAADPAETQVTIASLKGSIPQTMAEAAAPYGDFVSATLSRVLVWDLDLRRDLRPNDQIEALWRLGSTDTVVIEAARYNSLKHNKLITAYRFQATGDDYPSYWAADGTEVPYRLQNSPLAGYEQITSLLRDRPNHHGMDFKVEVGTPVLATRDGVVTRVNWNWKANGNCVEVQHSDGVVAKYLHLSENKVKEGDRVKTGEVLALSGNTGHSTGPHLHYQLNKGAKVIDPIDYHGTNRRELPEGDRAKFEAVVRAANEQLDARAPIAQR